MRLMASPAIGSVNEKGMAMLCRCWAKPYGAIAGVLFGIFGCSSGDQEITAYEREKIKHMKRMETLEEQKIRDEEWRHVMRKRD